jgi:hypothetical protein
MPIQIKRRDFLQRASLAAGAMAVCPREVFGKGDSPQSGLADPSESSAISFWTSDAVYQARYQAALDVLASNTQTLAPFAEPVLIEGSSYQGIWFECAPQEGLVYSWIRPEIARNNHRAFFQLQREDGWVPCSVKNTGAGWGQIQMVVPIAATAWELAQQTKDSGLLDQAYKSCAQWDEWLVRYRNTRGTGLCEGFCTYDTGHDNSPRWAGLPNRCPDADARKCPPIASLPRLCPDLSATVFGGRIALAAMARALGKNDESDHWTEAAETVRKKIVDRLYDERDGAFYDLDAQNQFVRIRGDVITRVLGEHVVDQRLFDAIYQKQIHNPSAFWAPYPLPSIALDDPAFVRPIPRNSWGGATQALTALRAPRWMEHYGRPADLARLMQQWTAALVRATGFWQQMDPLTGDFTKDSQGYSPAALVLIDYTWRLHGVRAANDSIEWNVRPWTERQRATFRLRVNPVTIAELKYEAGTAELRLNDQTLLRTSGTVRLITGQDGTLHEAIGISDQRTSAMLDRPGHARKKIAIEPNQRLSLKV